jgi:hypothetical protein
MSYRRATASNIDATSRGSLSNVARFTSPTLPAPYDAEVTERDDGLESDVLESPVVALAAGTAAVAVQGGRVAARLLTGLPVVGPLVRRGVDELTTRGDQVIKQGLGPLRTLVTAIAVQVVDLVLAELDLTKLVREKVDIDAIVAEIDIDAIIARIDLVGLSNQVIDGVDLPAIIRESTNSVSADVMTDVRSQGERADDIVAGVVDRMLGRNRDRNDAS